VKALKLFTFTLVALSAALTKPAHAMAGDGYGDDSRYYTAETFRSCKNQGRNTLVGGLGGGALGAGVGALASRGNTGATIIGGLLGGFVGAVAGSELSCNDKAYFVEHVDQHLSRDDYWNPSEDDRTRVVVVRSGYASNQAHCRTYYTEYRGPNGWIEDSYRTACWDGRSNRWVHGYDESIIVNEIPRTYVYPVWFRERPVYAARFKRERYDRYENDRRERESDRRERREDYRHIYSLPR
jgi:surface antigen